MTNCWARKCHSLVLALSCLNQECEVCPFFVLSSHLDDAVSVHYANSIVRHFILVIDIFSDLVVSHIWWALLACVFGWHLGIKYPRLSDVMSSKHVSAKTCRLRTAMTKTNGVDPPPSNRIRVIFSFPHRLVKDVHCALQGCLVSSGVVIDRNKGDSTEYLHEMADWLTDWMRLVCHDDWKKVHQQLIVACVHTQHETSSAEEFTEWGDRQTSIQMSHTSRAHHAQS